MSKILIIDIDCKTENLALKKIEKYHLNLGDEVIWNNELLKNSVDKIYVSSIFDWNKDKCKEWEGIAEIGGSGWDIEKTLPKEIEEVQPHINLGFTTRGCFRRCPFCIVHKKEGDLKVVGDIYDLWDGKSKEIELLDNNIIGLPDHFKKIWSQIKKEKLKVKENGLDIRLINDDIAKILASVKHAEYHFAFDNMHDEEAVAKGIEVLVRNGIKTSTFYVIVGYNTTPEQDLYRCNFLRDRKQHAYIQRFHSIHFRPFYVSIARWANQKHIFKYYTWEDFINHESNRNYKRRIEEDKL